MACGLALALQLRGMPPAGRAAATALDTTQVGCRAVAWRRSSSLRAALLRCGALANRCMLHTDPPRVIDAGHSRHLSLTTSLITHHIRHIRRIC